jgi:hypothetical protein
MRYLTSISLALIVLMALACTATPAEPTPAPTPNLPTYTDTEVLKVLEKYAKETARKDWPSTTPLQWSNCWRSLERLEYAVVRRASNSNTFDVTGKARHVEGHIVTATWVIRMDATSSTYKHTGSDFVKTPTGQVTPTSVQAEAKEFGC